MTEPIQAALPRAPRPSGINIAELRAKSVAWAREIVSSPGIVFLDTETTGLGPDAEIVDIGVVAIDGTVYLDCLVKPAKPIPPGATAVHGITDEMVADAEPWKVVYGWLLESISGRVIVYNRDYDLGVINQLCRALDLPQLGTHERWECAMLAFSDFKGELGKYGSMKWHRLEVAAAEFGIPPGGHRALADAETARRVVLAMAAGLRDKRDSDSGSTAE